MFKAKNKSLLVFLSALLMLSGCGKTKSATFPLVSMSSGQNATIETDVNNNTALSELLEGAVQSAAVYTADGDVIYTDADNIVLHKGGGASVNAFEYSELSGVITDYSGSAVTDVYDLAVSALDSGKRVMVLYLDGFGWSNYERALKAGVIPNLSALSAQQAISMYPTITPVNYAAMVTGKAPKYNGVTARGIHTLACDTIFDYALSLGKKVFLSEGNTEILSFSVKQELNPDMNGNGDTDDEQIENTLAALKSSDSTLFFIHLHGIDDISHKYGPNSEETLSKIAQTDEWAGELIDGWDGKIIVIADHGQHATAEGGGDSEYADYAGTHGAFLASDILVPLLTN